MAITDPPPFWPIEPTTLYMVMYYPNNAADAEPTIQDNAIRDYNSAVQRCKDLITDNSNAGVAIIVPCVATIIFPSVPWQDF